MSEQDEPTPAKVAREPKPNPLTQIPKQQLEEIIGALLDGFSAMEKRWEREREERGQHLLRERRRSLREERQAALRQRVLVPVDLRLLVEVLGTLTDDVGTVRDWLADLNSALDTIERDLAAARRWVRFLERQRQ